MDINKAMKAAWQKFKESSEDSFEGTVQYTECIFMDGYLFGTKDIDRLLDKNVDQGKEIDALMDERDQLRKALKVAKKAVKQYAEMEDWGHAHTMNSDCDYGHSAREALAEIEKTLNEG